MNRMCEQSLLLHVPLWIKEAWDIGQLWLIFVDVSPYDSPVIISLHGCDIRACTCKAVPATPSRLMSVEARQCC